MTSDRDRRADRRLPFAGSSAERAEDRSADGSAEIALAVGG
jgi:hypothetical protein